MVVELEGNENEKTSRFIHTETEFSDTINFDSVETHCTIMYQHSYSKMDHRIHDPDPTNNDVSERIDYTTFNTTTLHTV